MNELCLNKYQNILKQFYQNISVALGKGLVLNTVN